MSKTVLAKYVKQSLCKCGHLILKESIPLGKVYTVHPDSIEDGALICGGCGKKTPLKIIFIDATATSNAGMLPLGIFELGWSA